MPVVVPPKIEIGSPNRKQVDAAFAELNLGAPEAMPRCRALIEDARIVQQAGFDLEIPL